MENNSYLSRNIEMSWNDYGTVKKALNDSDIRGKLGFFYMIESQGSSDTRIYQAQTEHGDVTVGILERKVNGSSPKIMLRGKEKAVTLVEEMINQIPEKSVGIV